MFTENHQKVLEESRLGFSDMQSLSNKVGLSVAQTEYLVSELHDYGFITHVKVFQGYDGITLKSKGQFAVESPDHFIGKPMNPQSNNWTGDRIAGDKIGGDKVLGNKLQIGTVQGDAIAGNKITHAQNLAEAAQEIQTLIDQLAQSYPTTTMPEKVGFASAIVQQIDTNPSLSTRVLSASKAGGTAAIGQFLNHPLSSFIIAAIEDWQKTKQP